MYRVGIDIGSTSAKVVAMDRENEIVYKKVMPTGWARLRQLRSFRRILRKAASQAEAGPS